MAEKFDLDKTAEMVANVLVHNKELVNDPEQFSVLLTCLWSRLYTAYRAGQQDAQDTSVDTEKAAAPKTGVTLVVPPPPMPRIPLS